MSAFVIDSKDKLQEKNTLVQSLEDIAITTKVIEDAKSKGKSGKSPLDL